MSAADRSPCRLELETAYPRLVPPGQTRGADVWPAHGRLILSSGVRSSDAPEGGNAAAVIAAASTARDAKAGGLPKEELS